MIFGIAASCVAQNSTTFPLKISENGRYLVDSNETPFLIKEFSAWGMAQALSEKDEFAMMDSLSQKGFNTLLVSAVSNATDQMGGDPPYWQGISPFKVHWDFSTPNEAYFEHLDRFLNAAEEKGFFIMLVPCYLGYYTAGGQGWWDEVRSKNNSPEKMREYGEFLGKRYRNQSNIMWVAGGDNDAKGIDEPYMKNLIKGIKSFDKKHLWTGHFCNTFGNYWSSYNPLYKDVIDIDGHYVWKELGSGAPQYVTELEQYQKGKMIIQLDQSYEHDVPHFADNENPQWIRRKMWDGLLSGCAGTSFSSGTIDNQAYWMKDWRPLMSTLGMKEVSYCFSFFNEIPWQNLMPDTTNKIIVSGQSEYGSLEYICSAKSANDNYYIMYIPTGRTIYVNVKEISGKKMRVHWFNPRTGDFLKMGHVSGDDDNFGLVCPDANDWVLVFDRDPKFNPTKNY
jgi:hypothetical protein